MEGIKGPHGSAERSMNIGIDPANILIKAEGENNTTYYAHNPFQMFKWIHGSESFAIIPPGWSALLLFLDFHWDSGNNGWFNIT